MKAAKANFLISMIILMTACFEIKPLVNSKLAFKKKF